MDATPRLQFAALLLSAWLGAALLVVAVVTPGAFASLPTRSMAGTMVGVSPGAVATAVLSGAACAVAQFGIAPRLVRLRSEIGGSVERLSADDPRRVAFGLLHGYSVAGLGVAMLAAVFSLVFVLVALRPRS
jgi:hypothetical protein